LLYSVQ